MSVRNSFLRLPLYLALCFPETQAFVVGSAVRTSSGIIEGHVSQWQPQVSEYLGIPYAAPPVGELRWQYPHPIVMDGEFKAERYGADCPSNAPMAISMVPQDEAIKRTLGPYFQAGHAFSEDCLTLNIWSKPQTGEQAKAVLVFFYGGAFIIGSTNNPAYNGARLANDQDIVVVTVNSRVNIFGFPNAPGIPHINLGLLDQRLAVEWVRDNIVAFGGDPKRITISGNSSGGSSVDFFSLAWEEDSIVNGLILQSGSSLSGAGQAPVAKSEKYSTWFTASSKLGCGGKEAGNRTVDCMRNKSMREIMDHTAANFKAFSDFGPTIDDKVIFSDNVARVRAARFAKVPMLVGSNDNEAGIAMVLTKGSYGFFGWLANSALGSMTSSLTTLLTCSARDAAESRFAAGVKTWRYRYYGAFPNTALAPTAGAYHGSEVPMIFGTTEFLTRSPDTRDEAKLSKAMMTAWATFAKDPVNGLTALGWPTYAPNTRSLVRIGWQNQSSISAVDPSSYDGSCSYVLSWMGIPDRPQQSDNRRPKEGKRGSADWEREHERKKGHSHQQRERSERREQARKGPLG